MSANPGELSRLVAEIERHQATIAKAATLEGQRDLISEAIGRIAATDEAVARIEAAVTEHSAAEAALNPVATTVFFEIDHGARGRVNIDGTPLNVAEMSRPVVAKTVIGIEGVGKVTVEPRIKSRDTVTKRLSDANAELKAALEAVNAGNLAAARRAVAERHELERQAADIRREISGLAPGNRAIKLAPGLDALRNFEVVSSRRRGHSSRCAR